MQVGVTVFGSDTWASLGTPSALRSLGQVVWRTIRLVYSTHSARLLQISSSSSQASEQARSQ